MPTLSKIVQDRKSLEQQKISRLSFDTIRLTVDFLSSESDILEKFTFCSESSGFNLADLSDYTYKTIYLVSFAELDSYDSSDSFIRATLTGQSLTLQMSVPKCLLGQSLGHVFDLSPFLQALSDVFTIDYGLVLATSWLDWRLNRIDVAWNFDTGSEENCKSYISQLSVLNYRGIKPLTKGRKTLPYWPSQTRTIKFYCKLTDTFKKKNDYDVNFISQISGFAKRILRYEEEWRTPFLLRKMNLESSACLTVSAFLSFAQSWNAQTHFEKLSQQFCRSVKHFDFESARTVIYSSFKKRKPFLDLLDAVANYGLNGGRVHLNLSNSTYHYRRAALLDVGIDLGLLDNSRHESHFSFVDLPNVFELPIYDNFDQSVFKTAFFYKNIRSHLDLSRFLFETIN